MKKISAVLLAAVLVGVLAACSAEGAAQGSQSRAPEGTAVSVRGEITSRSDNPDGSVTILVEGQKEQDTEYDSASVTVTDKTSVTKKDGAECSLSDLQVGVRVEAYMSGPVAESYPVQGGASAVVILP
jgi:hypothetical protein